MAVNLNSFVRPNTVSIFKFDPLNPVDVARVTTLLLTNVVFPTPGRVRLDTTNRYTVTRGNRIARSPVERIVTTNIRKNPITLDVQGTLSATPLYFALPLNLSAVPVLGQLGSKAAIFGAFGSIVRRDLSETDKLRIITSGEPVVIATPSETFASMGCELLSEEHDGANRVRLSLRFSEVRIVSPLSLNLGELLPGAGGMQSAGPATQSVPDPGGLG